MVTPSFLPIGVRRRIFAALALAALLGLPGAIPAAAATEPIPNSMSSLGDSITRGYDACGFFIDCPQRSWSTGTYSTVNSHYLRILAKNAKISGHNNNGAKTGAKMIDLDGQARVAVSQQVDYVTVLIGANDACTSTEAAMTAVDTFGGQFEQAMATLSSGLPNARIFVSSIPNPYRLWQIGKDNSSARSAWANFGICQSMLANPLSTAQADVDRRQRVQQRVADFNTKLAAVCAEAQHPHCKFDGNAVFNYQFVLSQVSTWDYFHPNTAGQAKLAEVTYNAGFAW